jgi:hypothetical protein
MLAAKPPYALASTSFRFGALASLAGRAPLGGQREVALAVYVAARLADDVLPERGLSHEARVERAAGARHWVSMLALPTPLVRASLMKLFDASAGTRADVAEALGNVITVTALYLEPASRGELDQLAKALSAAKARA